MCGTCFGKLQSMLDRFMSLTHFVCMCGGGGEILNFMLKCSL